MEQIATKSREATNNQNLNTVTDSKAPFMWSEMMNAPIQLKPIIPLYERVINFASEPSFCSPPFKVARYKWKKKKEKNIYYG